MVREAIRKADALIEALPYIMMFRNKTFVIKFGGSAMDEADVLADVLEDVVFLAAVGIRPILVHGGGPHITAEMKARGIEPTFVAGHRVTDETTLQIAMEVLAGKVSGRIIERIEEFGGRGVCSFSEGSSLLKGEKKLLEVPGPDGKVATHDVGSVGHITDIDEDGFRHHGAEGRIVVIPPIAQGPSGEFYNVNADTAASAVAARMHAEKIVLLSNVPGILLDENDPDSVASTLSEEEVKDLMARGVIHGGMLPKVQACLDVLEHGVRKAHIIDARMNHAMLLEIFTDKGIGTQIVR
jgi:acetylglutamate kinase